MKQIEDGWFITLEGGEGAGKSTQIGLLTKYLEDQYQMSVLSTFEPGGTKTGQALRKIIKDPQYHLSTSSQALLLLADRIEHVVTFVREAMTKGYAVISDRYHDSTTVYQLFAQAEQDEGLAKMINTIFDTSIKLWPDLTLLLDTPAEVALKRTRARAGEADRFDDKDITFYNRLRQGFLALQQAHPDRIKCVDGNGNQAVVAKYIEHEVDRYIRENFKMDTKSGMYLRRNKQLTIPFLG